MNIKYSRLTDRFRHLYLTTEQYRPALLFFNNTFIFINKIKYNIENISITNFEFVMHNLYFLF